MDSNYKKREFLINLKQLLGDYRGEIQAKIILKLTKKYDILKKLKYFITNNASSNNTLAGSIETFLATMNIK